MPQRKHPADGVSSKEFDFPILFLTVCTKNRRPRLATKAVHCLLRATWQKAGAWLVGKYVVMPDHLHLFADPGPQPLAFDHWVRYWKSQFTKVHRVEMDRWQVDHWDTRLRTWESYDQKWLYVRDNPTRQ